MNKFLTLAFLIVAVIANSGCSTISGSGTTQSLSVQTFASDGKEVEGAKCDMTNDEGTWFVVTPGSTVLHRSNKDLQVICKKAGAEVGTANVVSRTKGNMYANLLLGGGLGMIVDHNNGSAYEYPPLIKIFMGTLNQKIDEKTNMQVPPSNPDVMISNTSVIPPPSPLKNPPENISPTSERISFDVSSKKCVELGFEKGTDKFNACVVKLSQ
jgi:hypothetical protein